MIRRAKEETPMLEKFVWNSIAVVALILTSAMDTIY